MWSRADYIPGPRPRWRAPDGSGPLLYRRARGGKGCRPTLSVQPHDGCRELVRTVSERVAWVDHVGQDQLRTIGRKVAAVGHDALHVPGRIDLAAQIVVGQHQ